MADTVRVFLDRRRLVRRGGADAALEVGPGEATIPASLAALWGLTPLEDDAAEDSGGRTTEDEADAGDDRPQTTGDGPSAEGGDPESPVDAGHASDDLTVIKGIGPRTAEDLMSVGVFTFADLAVANAHDLARRLNGSSPRQVQAWIDEARQWL